VYVDVASAHAYARWAGMRLPSEEEFQRAARGDTRRLYPWGEAWDPARVVSIETSGDGPRPVGSRPAGASPEGVLDLAGNVWEWTSSPYAPYAKHRADRLRLTGNGAVRFVELVGEWDPDRRVSVGGSYLNGALGLRATTRRSVERYWTLEALGFRSAASPRAGLDVATAVVRDDLPRSIRSEHDFDLDGLVAIDRWRSRAGTVSLSPPSTSEHADVRLGPYAVVTAYDWLLFVPVADVDDSMLAVMRKRSAAEEPLVLGVLSTSLALASPAVGAGTWIVRWRCEDGTGPARLELSDLAGGRVAAIEHDGPREERMREGSIATEDDGTVRVDAVIRVARNRALTLDLVLRLAPEDRARLAGDWRR
jgi:hypothetical protein